MGVPYGFLLEIHGYVRQRALTNSCVAQAGAAGAASRSTSDEGGNDAGTGVAACGI